MSRLWASLYLVPLLACAQDQPVIRVGTRLVEVDVVVRDKKGPVAADLTGGDFSLFDQSKPQRIAVFSLTTGTQFAGQAGASSARRRIQSFE